MIIEIHRSRSSAVAIRVETQGSKPRIRRFWAGKQRENESFEEFIARMRAKYPNASIREEKDRRR